MIEESRAGGHTSLRAIAAYLTAQGLETRRGKTWAPTAIRNALQQQTGLPRLPDWLSFLANARPA